MQALHACTLYSNRTLTAVYAFWLWHVDLAATHSEPSTQVALAGGGRREHLGTVKAWVLQPLPCSPARDPLPSWHVGIGPLWGDGNGGVEEVCEAGGPVLRGVYVRRA